MTVSLIYALFVTIKCKPIQILFINSSRPTKTNNHATRAYVYVVIKNQLIDR